MGQTTHQDHHLHLSQKGHRCRLRQGKLLVAQEPGFHRLVVQQRQILPFTLSLDQSFERRGFLHTDRYEAETTIHTEAEISTNSYETFLSSPIVSSAQNLYLQSEQVFELFRIPNIEFRNLQAFSMNTVDYRGRRIFSLRPTPPTFAHQVTNDVAHFPVHAAHAPVHIFRSRTNRPPSNPVRYCPNLVFAGFQLQQFRSTRGEPAPSCPSHGRVVSEPKSHFKTAHAVWVCLDERL
jgi:hypothetical protein